MRRGGDGELHVQIRRHSVSNDDTDGQHVVDGHLAVSGRLGIHQANRSGLAWIFGLALLAAYFGYFARTALPVMGDFRAFYCAANVVRTGGDPYHYGPLAACEQPLLRSTEPQALRFPVVPVPLPGYAIALFVPLSFFPFPLACALWLTILSAATWATVVLMAALTKLPALALAAALLPVNIGMSAMLGQPAPVVILALVAAASLLRANRDRWAAAVAAVAMLEPHIGVGACVSLFLFRRRTRGVLSIAALAAIVATVATVGIHGALEYVTAVVPAHALANATEARQLSLTSLLWLAGVGSTDAVRFGNAMFVTMLVTGIFVAARIAAARDEAAYLVLVPPAFAMFGGVHVHVTQLIVIILPLLLVAAEQRASRPLVIAAIASMMLPWHIMLLPPLMLLAPFMIAAFAIPMQSSARTLPTIAIPLFVFGGVAMLAASGHGPHATVFVPHEYAANSLVQDEWGDYVRAVFSSTDLLMLWLRVPSWIGAAIGVFFLTSIACRRVKRPSGNLGHVRATNDALPLTASRP